MRYEQAQICKAWLNGTEKYPGGGPIGVPCSKGCSMLPCMASVPKHGLGWAAASAKQAVAAEMENEVEMADGSAE